MKDVLQKEEDLKKFDFIFEVAVQSIIKETKAQLFGDKHLETDLKNSIVPSKHSKNDH